MNHSVMYNKYSCNHQVEYPDVEALYKKLGTSATAKKPDGSPFYTLPVIHDPNTGTTVSDSFQIAEYLDKTYPDTPRVIPPGTRALQAAFIDASWSKMVGNLFKFLMPKVSQALNKSGEEYFRRTREAAIGSTLEEMYPTGDKAEEVWKNAEADFAVVYGWLREDEFVIGDKISFADFAIGGVLVVSRVLLGEESEEWKRMLGWHNGRWARIAKSLEKYEKGA
jgi:glutathione S-transferase